MPTHVGALTCIATPSTPIPTSSLQLSTIFVSKVRPISIALCSKVHCVSSYRWAGSHNCSRIMVMATISEEKTEPQAQTQIPTQAWIMAANPYAILGLKPGCSQEDVKVAFRAKVKEYHPDVYKGREDAAAITQRLIGAYERLTADFEDGVTKSDYSDPFEVPECHAEDIFVNELVCIGRGCPYPCVATAPQVFAFADDTGCARARAAAKVEMLEYQVQLAVGQCPRLCIHYVTPAQRVILEDLLRRALEGQLFSSEVSMLNGLIARANFENGRYTPSKRQPKQSSKMVDWF